MSLCIISSNCAGVVVALLGCFHCLIQWLLNVASWQGEQREEGGGNCSTPVALPLILACQKISHFFLVGKISFQKYKIYGWKSTILGEWRGKNGILSTPYLLGSVRSLQLSKDCNFPPPLPTFLTHDAVHWTWLIPVVIPLDTLLLSDVVCYCWQWIMAYFAITKNRIWSFRPYFAKKYGSRRKINLTNLN